MVGLVVGVLVGLTVGLVVGVPVGVFVGDEVGVPDEVGNDPPGPKLLDLALAPTSTPVVTATKLMAPINT